ncbi:hypothetical protein [Arthrobacter sp. 35W]|uniref:hypothetical protein n=1 Tax=Arthrobacter sp. 35W TaxID=1132441 RepID=UPI000479ABE7|nr:hypothetical protein [Arthrobacter sp. 35W]
MALEQSALLDLPGQLQKTDVTPMTSNLDVAKISAETVVASTYDGLDRGELWLLVDDVARSVRDSLSGPLAGPYPQLQPQI